MKRLIVNADDFGLAVSVNDAIIATHKYGIVTSASLLANGPAFSQAVASSFQFPELSIGVHLNLSAGPPLSSAATLVNGRGELYLTPLQLWIEILRRRVRLEDIRKEFRAQIAKVFDAGITPNHLDGHLHVHVVPAVAQIVIDLAREFRISNVRVPAENLEVALPPVWKLTGPSFAAIRRSGIALGVSSLAASLRNRLRNAGLCHTNAFFGLVQTGFLNEKTLPAVLRAVPQGTTELMCHPGYKSAELESTGGDLTAERETEVLALTSPRAREVLDLEGIQLISFRDVDGTVAAQPRAGSCPG
jgi:predicted glycoside hydrolase/deacetylase ChbG (UPF0249 family)